MFSLPDRPTTLCDGNCAPRSHANRRIVRAGTVAASTAPRPSSAAQPSAGSRISGPNIARAAVPRNSSGRAKSVIFLWLLGGPPQHESWDPKPNAPAEVRGEFNPIQSAVPGFMVGELMPRTALLTQQIAALRAVVTNDQAHSSSGYQMLTGVPHIPLSQENVTSKVPNVSPSHAAIMRALQPDLDGMPSSISLPHHIANDGEIVWPGQTAGVSRQTVRSMADQLRSIPPRFFHSRPDTASGRLCCKTHPATISGGSTG